MKLMAHYCKLLETFKKKKLRTASVEEENRKLTQILSDFLYSGVPIEIIVK